MIDLAAAEMRQLMDLRVKPNYQAPVRSFVELHPASHLPPADQAVSMIQSPHPLPALRDDLLPEGGTPNGDYGRPAVISRQ